MSKVKRFAIIMSGLLLTGVATAGPAYLNCKTIQCCEIHNPEMSNYATCLSSLATGKFIDSYWTYLRGHGDSLNSNDNAMFSNPNTSNNSSYSQAQQQPSNTTANPSSPNNNSSNNSSKQGSNWF